MSNVYNEQLRRLITEEFRMYHFGVANLDRIIDYIHPSIMGGAKDLKYAIVSSLQLSTNVTATITKHPTLLYKHHYAQLNYLLDRNALQISQWIMKQGFHAMPIPASQVIDYNKQMGHFCHRHAAVEAGLGWIGKNNLLVSPELGTHQRLITILTDLPLETGSPIENQCRDCQACIKACPAGALSDDSFDFDKCYQQLNEFRKIRGIGHHICGFCVKACKGSDNRK